MAAVVVDQAWRDSAPESVEHDLAELWRELAGRGTVARAVMSNLVVFRLHERRRPDSEAGRVHESASDEALQAVIAQHPSRTIVIEHDRGEHCEAAPIGARVGVSVFGPPSARYGVDQVVLRSACSEQSLPSIVRRFAQGDLPTSIWWCEDVSAVPPLPALVAMARQLVYDSRKWRDIDVGAHVLSAIADDRRVDLADLNWRRLEPVRRALAHAPRPIGNAIAASSVRITHRRGDEALACLLAGWFVGRLGWPASDRSSWPVLSELGSGSGEEQRDEDLALTIGDTSLAMNDHRVRLVQPGAAPLILPLARDSDSEAVAAELRSLSADLGLRDALVALAGRPLG